MTVGELEQVRADILAIDPQIITLEGKISVEQDAAKRTKLETELAGLNTKYNEMVQMEQVKLAKSQTLERYIEKGKTWVDQFAEPSGDADGADQQAGNRHQAACCFV